MAFLTRAKRSFTLPAQLEIGIEGVPVVVRLRSHPRALRYTLRVGRTGADPVVTIPRGGSLAGARHFLESHSGWLGERLSALPQARPLAPGQVIPLRGVSHRIRHRVGSGGTVEVETGVRMPFLTIYGEAEHLPRRLTDWLKQQARRDLERAVFRHAAKIGVRPAAIRLRDPKARWGSCSSRKTLSFSWRLIMAPPFVLGYLAAHEVAHLRELHHGPSFWRLLRRICRHTDSAEAWLRAHGASLHAIGVTDRYDGYED
jgi:predicted metal-dependent hydrolase